MTQPVLAQPLQMGRGLRILNVEMVQDSGELDSYNLSNAAMTVLTGIRNSSKTTTLKVIDYCLGGRGSLPAELGAAVASKYLAFSIDIAVDGSRHRLKREFDFGKRGQVIIDDDLALPVEQASDWLLSRLSWPSLAIPLGRNAATATRQTPLSFRSALRHIYRREDSWTEFAIKEEEYLRRAVISLFLGFAPQRYETADFQLGQAQREQAAAAAVFRDVVASTDEAVRAVVSQLGLPPVVDAGSLSGVRLELSRRLQESQLQRDRLVRLAATASRQGDEVPGLDPDLPAQLESAASAAGEAAERAANLGRVLAEHERSVSLVEADIARLHRLVDAVDVFDELPVRLCPACEQAVDPSRNRGDQGMCYLCRQPVTGDVRKRRAEREQRTLASEQADLVDAIARTRADLEQAQSMEASASEQRSLLAQRLHDERVAQLAPFMAALEDIATEIGRIEQQLAALPALETILTRRVIAEQSVASATQEVERLMALSQADARAARDSSHRCADLANSMNSFLENFRDRGWVASTVTVSAEDLTFYVGTLPWEDNLGAEARVLFFLAYSFAILNLTATGDERTCPPGVLLLDNPYQQGLPADVVADAIDRVANVANETGTQVVLTQARSAINITAPHAEIRMPVVYDVKA